MSNLCLLVLLASVYGQDDFIGRKYSAINNVSTINFGNSTNLQKVVTPSITKYPGNPLFGQDKPWEPRIDNGYPNVVYTPNASDPSLTYQLWYDSFLTTSPFAEGTLYAKSVDGISWVKPDLGLVKWDGSTDNNIIWDGSGGVGVNYDIHTTNASERYKAFGVFPSAQGVCVSSDGLHWTDYRQLDLDNHYDTHNNLFFDSDPKVMKYFLVTRGPDVPPRTVAISKSTPNDFNSAYTNADVVESGGNDNQTYAQITFIFNRIFYGLVMVFDSTSSDGRVYCELAWSPNMYDWYRIREDQQLIPLSPLKPVTYDSYVCFTAAYPVVVGGQIRLYYFGGNGPHSGDRNESFAMATVSLDGFAGITNKQNGKVGMANSWELLCDGQFLEVSVDVMSPTDSARGYIKVGIANMNGFQLSDSDAVSKNVTDYVVSWNGVKDISKFMGNMLVLQFEISQATLYTFQFTNTTKTL